MDPFSTGTPGAHPLGAGAGAVFGGLSGAAPGTVAGPIGAVIGAAAGAVMGGLVGKSTAEAFNPTAEELFWKETYIREPYYVQGRGFEYYAPGFRAGWQGRVRRDGRSFDQAEAELLAEYELSKSESLTLTGRKYDRQRVPRGTDAIRLYFKNTARNEDKLFAAIGHFDTHRTWLDTGNQRRVLRQNAQLARFPWQSYKPSLTRKNGLFCADHIDMESVHRCSWEKGKG